MPGSTFTASISLGFVANITGCGVKEHYPEGWTVSGLSNGGSQQNNPSRIEWILFTGSPLTDQNITYQVTVPSNASGVYTFSGLVLPAGAFSNSTIIGSQSITIAQGCTMNGNQPPCNIVEIGEILNAITSWASGTGTSIQDILNLIMAWANGGGN